MLKKSAQPFFMLTGRISILLLLFIAIKCNSSKEDKISIENAGKGEILFNSSGCPKCHTGYPDTRYGPALDSIFEKELIVVRNGKTIKARADRQYIINSMQHPDMEKPDGFLDRKMPAVNLTSEDINYIADYLIFINTKGRKKDKE